MSASARVLASASWLCLACACASAAPAPEAPASPGPAASGSASSAPAPEPGPVEQKAAHWAAELGQPGDQTYAARRLLAVSSQAQARVGRKAPGPGDEAALAAALPALAHAYDHALIEPELRTALLRLLVDARAAAARPVAVQIVERFAEGRAQYPDMALAARFVAENRVKEASEPLLRAFFHIRYSDKELGPAFTATREAMFAVADPAWTPALTRALAPPIPAASAGAAAGAAGEARDQVAWQRTSVELLGELRAASAVRSLFGIVLQRDKALVAGEAARALLRIGKPAVAPLLVVLAGGDDELSALAVDVQPAFGVPPATPRQYATRAAASVLGGIGRAEAGEPMLAALAAATGDTERAALARELGNLPRSKASIAAFEKTFEQLPLTAVAPDGSSALTSLAVASERALGAAEVPWLLAQVKAVARRKGEADAIDAVQQALLAAASKLAKKEQRPALMKLVASEGDDATKRQAELRMSVADACGASVACYLARVGDSSAQQQAREPAGAKAAFMIGELGDRAAALELARLLPSVSSAAIRIAALSAIDRLCPAGDQAVADELRKLAGATESPEGSLRIWAAVYRLDARLP